LQCVAECLLCSDVVLLLEVITIHHHCKADTLQHIAAHYTNIHTQHSATHCSSSGQKSTHIDTCNALQHTTTLCNALQRIAAAAAKSGRKPASHCNTLQHTATHCNTLQQQHTATKYCNTLQQRRSRVDASQRAARRGAWRCGGRGTPRWRCGRCVFNPLIFIWGTYSIHIYMNIHSGGTYSIYVFNRFIFNRSTYAFECIQLLHMFM